MDYFTPNPTKLDAAGNATKVPFTPKGLIFFCETNLRYESGWKAWMFLGPYLGLAIFLETLITASRTSLGLAIVQWLGFLVYLVFFPPVWGRILKLIALRKGTMAMSNRRSNEASVDLNAKKSIGLL
jgi:hypothetical protein